MARRQDELVAAIRRERQALRQEVQEFLALEPLKAQIRDKPGPWLAGGLLAGALAASFLVGPLWQKRGQLARSWVRSRLKDVVVALFLATVRQIPRVAARMDGGTARPEAVPRQAVPRRRFRVRPRPVWSERS